MHVTRLKPFFGTREGAYDLAKKDTDQFEVDRIFAYRGDPDKRATMEFLFRFMNGDETWLPYSQDIFQMQQFENFCVETPGSRIKGVPKPRIKEINRQHITMLGLGHSIYVDICTFGDLWYQSIGFPDMYTTHYVDKWAITGWKKEPLQLYAYSDVFNAPYILTHEGVTKWGRWFVLEECMIEVITPEHLEQYPVLKDYSRGLYQFATSRIFSCILFFLKELDKQHGSSGDHH